MRGKKNVNFFVKNLQKRQKLGHICKKILKNHVQPHPIDHCCCAGYRRSHPPLLRRIHCPTGRDTREPVSRIRRGRHVCGRVIRNRLHVPLPKERMKNERLKKGKLWQTKIKKKTG